MKNSIFTAVLIPLFILCVKGYSADILSPVMDCEDIATTICSGETYEFESQVFNETCVYELTSVNCTGTFDLNLTVIPKPADSVTEASICAGESYVWTSNGVAYYETGTYEIINDGCTADEILILTVVPKPNDVITEVTLCEGQTYLWAVNGQEYTVDGVYMLQNDGCTADDVLNLTVIDAGPQPPESCYGVVEIDINSCLWDVEDYYPLPDTECYESAAVDPVTCLWVITGEMPTEPQNLECYETATFNTITCVWDVTSDLPVEPAVECYETAFFNEITCQWEVEGEMPEEPSTECYETAEFDDLLCKWFVEGEIPAYPPIACYEVATFNTTDCQWDIQGQEPEEPQSDCWEYIFSEMLCDWTPDGIPVPNCYDDLILNEADCTWNLEEGVMPEEPELECYETLSTFDQMSCAWLIISELDNEPSLECFQTATFDFDDCVWVIDENLPPYPDPQFECLGLYEFDYTCCEWVNTGGPVLEPLLECWETMEFNPIACNFTVYGIMPIEPTTQCHEGTAFDDTDCVWEVYDIWTPINEADTICNIVTGIIRLNEDDDCTSDIRLADIKIRNEVMSTFTNANGEYTLQSPQDVDSMVISIDPLRCDIIYPQDTILYFNTPEEKTLDYCLITNEVTDVNIMLCPLEAARPGIPTDYFIRYTNNGGLPTSGEVTLELDQMTLQSSDPTITSSVGNILTWEYDNLLPNESRMIDLTLVPDQTLLNGDKLKLIATINSTTTDKNLNNNEIIKTVNIVSSLDPNDITLIEGSPLPLSKIGEFVTFMIRFENKGTANANFVILRDTLNPDFFDVSTFEPVTYSHDCKIDIRESNQITVHYEDIELPFTVEDGNMGYFVYRVKLRDNLIEGDTISNQANIFFDFNPPILTNLAEARIGVPPILAIDEVAFYGDYDEEESQVNLQWNVTSEDKITHYTIERAIGNSAFNPIGSQETLDNSQYQYSDTTLGKGTHYYRLKVDRFDGAVDYSDIISFEVDARNTFDISINPNPTNEIFAISIVTDIQSSSQITIYNDFGKLITTQSTDQSQLQFDSSQYPSGVYIVKVQVGESVVSKKLVVL